MDRLPTTSWGSPRAFSKNNPDESGAALGLPLFSKSPEFNSEQIFLLFALGGSLLFLDEPVNYQQD